MTSVAFEYPQSPYLYARLKIENDQIMINAAGRAIQKLMAAFITSNKPTNIDRRSAILSLDRMKEAASNVRRTSADAHSRVLKLIDARNSVGEKVSSKEIQS